MRTLLVVVAVAGCGGSSKPAAAPPPATLAQPEKPEPVAVASDPEEGGQVASASAPPAAAAPPAVASAPPDDLQVSGDIDRDLVRRTIRAHMSAIKACYEKSLQANPSLQGKVTVTFTIEKDGTVKTAKAEGIEDNLDRCIEGRFETLTFPKATSTATIVYPFVFSN